MVKVFSMAKSVLLRGLTMQKWKIRRIRRAVWESTGAINPRWAEAADHSAFSRLVPIADYLGFKIIPAATLYWTTTISPFFHRPPFFVKKKLERLCAPCAHHLRLSCNLTNLTVWVVIAKSNSCKGNAANMQLCRCKEAKLAKSIWNWADTFI